MENKRTRLTVAQKAGWVRTGIYLPRETYAKVRAAAYEAGQTVSLYADKVFTDHFKRVKR